MTSSYCFTSTETVWFIRAENLTMTSQSCFMSTETVWFIRAENLTVTSQSCFMSTETVWFVRDREPDSDESVVLYVHRNRMVY